jgi:glycosyltransferase involved in cell wall biosynthesis
MSKPTPLVSVVTIFLDPEESFFEECIASVLAQYYENWEFLLVDDGSAEPSSRIARRYAKHFPDRIRYLEHENHQNRGKSASRNLGAIQARGKYVAYLDSDDVWLPQKLTRQVDILEQHPEVGLVFGPTLMWHSWTGLPEDVNRDRHRHPGVSLDAIIHPPSLLTRILRREGESPGMCGAMMRREVFAQVGDFDPFFRDMYEDQAFFSKIFLQLPVFVESDTWDRYRQHPNSCCHVAQAEAVYHPHLPNRSEQKFLEWLERYLSRESSVDTELTRALAAALLPYRRPWIYRLLQFKKSVRSRIDRLAGSFFRGKMAL